jgi:hypothetical protein
VSPERRGGAGDRAEVAGRGVIGAG